jgi:hypothetical protein
MGIKKWFRKTFRKSKVICVYIFDDTGRFKEYVVYPDKTNNIINIGEQSYVFSLKDVIYVNGFPSIFYKKNNPKPIDFKQDGKIPEITASEFNTILNNSVVKDLLKAGKENKNEQILLAGVGICVIGILILAYFTNTLMETLNAQQEIIKTLETEITKISSTIR